MFRCLRYCKSTIFQANHNPLQFLTFPNWLFAILQKYDFSSKSQQTKPNTYRLVCCLRYCKSTIFQANHNNSSNALLFFLVVCDTAKVRFFKQITTCSPRLHLLQALFAILQKYDFSSKSQPLSEVAEYHGSCLRYCKSTIFQANHNITPNGTSLGRLFAILQKYDFSSKSQLVWVIYEGIFVVCDTAKVRFFKQITTCWL